MRMHQFVHLSQVLRGEVRDADYLVVHPTPPLSGWPWPDLRGCLPQIAAALAEPVYRDDPIVVFTLAHASPLGNNHRPVQQ